MKEISEECSQSLSERENEREGEREKERNVDNLFSSLHETEYLARCTQQILKVDRLVCSSIRSTWSIKNGT